MTAVPSLAPLPAVCAVRTLNRTVVIAIGNSDDRLPQRKWAAYVDAVGVVIADFAERTHFFGTAPGHSAFQNAAWIVEVEADAVPELMNRLRATKNRFAQDSVALIAGDTTLIA